MMIAGRISAASKFTVGRPQRVGCDKNSKIIAARQRVLGVRCIRMLALLTFFGFFLESFQLLALTSNLQLVLFDLFIQIPLLFFQRLDPVADQRASAQTKPGTDARANTGMADRAAYDAADGGAAYRADGGTLLACRQRL
jgi:hypothetical protein